jgi:hypothetical protein
MFNNLNLIHEEICKGVKKANDYFNKNGIDAKAYMPENLTLINKTDGEKDMNNVIRHMSNNQIKKRAAEKFNTERSKTLLVQKTIKDNKHNSPNKLRIGAQKLEIGGKYNFKNQPERLKYIGSNWSGNGYWHQFEKVDEPGIVWSEMQDSELGMIESTVDEIKFD